MSSFYQRLRSYFGFTKTEINGSIVLLMLIGLSMFIPYFFSKWFSIDYDSNEDQIILDSLTQQLISAEERSKSLVALFQFDPNSLVYDSLLLLGIPANVAQRLINYRSAGGVFRKKTDLLKIYDFPDTLLISLSAYINIKPMEVPKRVDHNNRDRVYQEVMDTIQAIKSIKAQRRKSPIVLINSSDALEFQQLRGIGPVYSNRIVKFRKALGGFYSTKQIAEVYGLSDSLFRSIEPYLMLDTLRLKKIAINRATFQELVRHPYVGFEQAKSILELKSRIGKVRTVKDLIKMASFDSVTARRLNFYINYQ